MDSVAGHHSICSHATEDGKVSSSESESSHNKGDGTEEDDNAKEDKGRIETSSYGQVASDGEVWQEYPHTQDTLTSISQVFGEHEDRLRVGPWRENPVHPVKAAPKKPKGGQPPKRLWQIIVFRGGGATN